MIFSEDFDSTSVIPKLQTYNLKFGRRELQIAKVILINQSLNRLACPLYTKMVSFILEKTRLLPFG